MPLFYRDSVSGSAIDTIQTINSATSTTATAWASTVQAAFTAPGQTLSAAAISTADVGKTTTIVNTGTNAFTLAQTGGSITSAIGLIVSPGTTCALKAVSTTTSIIVGTNANQTASVEYGEQVLATSVSIPPTSTGAGNATDVLSFTLPSAGIWEVEYAVRATTPNQTATSVTGMVALVTNNSNVLQSGSEIAIARFQSGSTSGSGNNLGATASGKITITTAGAETFKLRGHHDGSANGSQAYSVQSDANGRTRVSWTKISGFTPVSGQAAGNGSVILNNQVFSTNVNVASTNGIYAIPSAGTWKLRYDIQTDGSGVAVINPMVAILTSAGAIVAGSEKARAGASTVGQGLTAEVIVTTTGASNYFLNGRIGAASGSFTILNTANAGQSTISWEQIGGFLPTTGQSVDYVNVYRTSDISVTGQTAIVFNAITSGNIPYNTSNGQFTLTAGKTYKLTGNVNVNQANASLFTAWYNVTSAAYISPGGRATSADSATSGYGTNQGEVIFTPTVTTIVELRNNLGSASTVAGAVIGSVNGVASQATIVQLGSTSNTVGTLPAVDQSSAGYFDIGNMRMQWGTTGSVFTNAIITFPAPFANANYSLSGIVPNNTTALFSGITTTTTTFTANLWNTNGGGGAVGVVRWIAIGQKP